MDKNDILLPFVSIIVPVYNNPIDIKSCIISLLEQTYDKNLYEIIIVDNGSSDNTKTIIKKYPVIYLKENDIQSSYAARNKGIKYARGKIIAFTDSDCTPHPDWLKEGIKNMNQQNADLCGGQVCFSYSPNPTGAEIWDSLTNMQIEQNINERSIAKTANLFVRSNVFSKIGYFPYNVKSGGDIIFTKRATSSGHKLIYASSAKIDHPTRKLFDLLKKQFRVGIGQSDILFQLKLSKSDFLNRLAYRAFPPPISPIRRLLKKSYLYTTELRLIRVWLASYICRMVTGAGNITAMIKRRIS